MGRKYTDNALTTLASSITAGSQTLTVAAGKGDNFPSVTGHGTPGSTPDYFIITMENSSGAREKIRVEQRSAGNDTLGTVGYPLVRGYDGTAAAAWSAGDLVDLRIERVGAQDHEDRVQSSRVAFGIKPAITVGLNFGYYGGAIVADGVLTTINDGAITLAASQTNYVERTPTGVVSSNTAGFSADKLPLYVAVTDATGITAATDKRAENIPIFGVLIKNVAGNADVTLSADEARAPIIVLSGAITGNINVNFPSVKRAWTVQNATSGLFTLTARVTGQTGTRVPQGRTLNLWGDGTDIREAHYSGATVSRSSNIQIVASDIRTTFVATGTFTQTFDAVASLGDGWSINYINEGTGVITFDPNGAETIAGQTTLAFAPGESGRIVCDGAALHIGARSREAGAIGSGSNLAARTNAVTPNTKIDISADELALKDGNGNTFVAKSIAVTVDFGIVGPNGIDAGAQAASTWYYGWVIAKSDGTVAGLGSTSSSAPTMPAGYVFKARITAARSDASTHFIKYRQNGNEVTYEAPQNVLNSGAVGAAETAVSLASFVPPSATKSTIAAYGFVTSTVGTAVSSGVIVNFVSGSDRQIASIVSAVITGVGSIASFGFECSVPNLAQQIFVRFLNTTNFASSNYIVNVNGFKLALGGE